MLNEILVIKESIPIFYYNRDPKVALSDDWYILQSGFFVALSQFANELTEDHLKYVILENRIYALNEKTNLLLVFGNAEKFTQDSIEKLNNEIKKAAKELDHLISKYDVNKFTSSPEDIAEVAKNFGQYLKTEKLIEDDNPINLLKSRSLMQKFIFKSIGYKPGQCNIGPAERLKRLLTGVVGFLLTLLGIFFIFYFDASHGYIFLLMIPLFAGFIGLYQYLFKFCVFNGLTKRYNMK